MHPQPESGDVYATCYIADYRARQAIAFALFSMHHMLRRAIAQSCYYSIAQGLRYSMDSATRSQPPVTDESNHKTRAYTFTKLLRTPSSCPQFPTISAKIKYTLDIPNEAALGTEQTALGYLDVLVEKLRPVELRVEVFVGSERVEEERGRCIAEWLMETIGAVSLCCFELEWNVR